MDARTGVKFGVTSRITATELARVWCVAPLAFFLDFSRNRPGPLLSRTGAQAPENAKRTRAASPSSQVEPAVKARHPLPKKDYMSLREIWRAQRPARPENTSPERKKARAPGRQRPPPVGVGHSAFRQRARASVRRNGFVSVVWPQLFRAACVTLRMPCRAASCFAIASSLQCARTRLTLGG
jgi:hypothetical protein